MLDSQREKNSEKYFKETFYFENTSTKKDF